MRIVCCLLLLALLLSLNVPGHAGYSFKRLQKAAVREWKAVETNVQREVKNSEKLVNTVVEHYVDIAESAEKKVRDALDKVDKTVKSVEDVIKALQKVGDALEYISTADLIDTAKALLPTDIFPFGSYKSNKAADETS